MKLSLSALPIVTSFSAWATLPSTPLEPVYHQLFNQRGDLAHRQAQRQAWEEALNAVVSRQCGKDLSPAAPEWLDDLTLTLMQRDMPLNRIYRITLSGKSPRHDINVTLALPDGKKAFAGMPLQYEAGDEFRVESEEFPQPLSEGVYVLTVSSGGQEWQQPLALQGVSGLTQIQLHDRVITLDTPQVPPACPRPWLEQTLLKRNDYNQIWWAKNDKMTLAPWPSQPADSVWATVAVVRAENRGGVTVRTEHRLAGPLVTMKN